MLSIWDGIKNGIGDRLGGVRDAVVNAMNAVYNAVMDKVNSSWSWGRDLMQNLINGITYMLGSLINTVADVARSIWEYLHFSVPEKGALTDVEEWMPDFMKGLAKGINKSKKYVEAAVSGAVRAERRYGRHLRCNDGRLPCWHGHQQLQQRQQPHGESDQ